LHDVQRPKKHDAYVLEALCIFPTDMELDPQNNFSHISETQKNTRVEFLILSHIVQKLQAVTKFKVNLAH